MERALAHQKVSGKRHDHQRQYAFNQVLMNAGQQRNAQRNAQKCRSQQPAGASQVDFPPVLHDDYRGDNDRKENGDGSGDLNRNTERQQRNCNQRLAKAKGRPNQSGEKHHEKNVQSGCIQFPCLNP